MTLCSVRNLASAAMGSALHERVCQHCHLWHLQDVSVVDGSSAATTQQGYQKFRPHLPLTHPHCPLQTELPSAPCMSVEHLSTACQDIIRRQYCRNLSSCRDNHRLLCRPETGSHRQYVLQDTYMPQCGCVWATNTPLPGKGHREGEPGQVSFGNGVKQTPFSKLLSKDLLPATAFEHSST